MCNLQHKNFCSSSNTDCSGSSTSFDSSRTKQFFNSRAWRLARGFLLSTTVASLFFFWSFISDFFVHLYTHSHSFFFVCFFFFVITVFFLTLSTFFFSVRGVHLITTIAISFFFFSQLSVINDIFFESKSLVLHIEFLAAMGSSTMFTYTLAIDFISFSFLFLTTSIGVCAIVYSLTYFKNEPNADRFLLFMNWFVISMATLVVADNCILMFFGWELIGLTSFFLINFWTTRRGTLKAALKAFIFNKLSDVFLLFFIVILITNTNSSSVACWLMYLSLADFVYQIPYAAAAIFLILASSIKSAQLGPHIWLPDSMEAPVPASALIHSATLVSAGVYLLLRFVDLLVLSNLHILVGLWGAATACYGAVVSAAQTDCKKLLAYSTISHCGFLFICVSLNNATLTIFYLYLHGFFKAMTFFCVGNIIRFSGGVQDSRQLGALVLLLPVETILLVICSFNLGALPLTVGFLYKHVLQLFLLNYPAVVATLPFIFVGMLCSCIYVFRLVFYSIFDFRKGAPTPSVKKELQFSFKTFNSNSTILSFLFIFFFLVFSFYLSSFYFEYLSAHDGLFAVSSSTSLNNSNFYAAVVAKLCFFYFYTFFGVVVFVLFSVECRAEFSYLKKRTIYTYFFVFVFFLFLLFSLTSGLIFTCEVKFVQSQPFSEILISAFLHKSLIFFVISLCDSIGDGFDFLFFEFFTILLFFE